MKEKCVVINKSFIDEFDMPLQEDAVDDFYTVSEIKQEVERRIARLAALDAEYAISPKSIIRYEIVSGGRSRAEVVPVDTHKYVFRIAKQTAVKRNEKYLDTIIYHELCHILQVDAILNMRFLYFEDGSLCYKTKDKDAVWVLYDKDEGHTSLWYSYADSVNDAFAINPPVSRYFNATEDISDAFLESTFRQEGSKKVRVANPVFRDDFSYLFKDEADSKEN